MQELDSSLHTTLLGLMSNPKIPYLDLPKRVNIDRLVSIASLLSGFTCACCIPLANGGILGVFSAGDFVVSISISSAGNKLTVIGSGIDCEADIDKIDVGKILKGLL